MFCIRTNCYWRFLRFLLLTLTQSRLHWRGCFDHKKHEKIYLHYKQKHKQSIAHLAFPAWHQHTICQTADDIQPVKHFAFACLQDLEGGIVSDSLPRFILGGWSPLLSTIFTLYGYNWVKTGIKLQRIKCLFPLVGHAEVGLLDLDVGRTRLFELISLVGVVEVLPHARELGGDVEVAVLLGSNLK